MIYLQQQYLEIHVTKLVLKLKHVLILIGYIHNENILHLFY